MEHSKQEIKSQGIIEAAQDPNSSINAEQAEQAVMKQARQAGAPAFEFDPDATPEQKAAQAKEVRTEPNVTWNFMSLEMLICLCSELVQEYIGSTRPLHLSPTRTTARMPATTSLHRAKRAPLRLRNPLQQTGQTATSPKTARTSLPKWVGRRDSATRQIRKRLCIRTTRHF